MQNNIETSLNNEIFKYLEKFSQIDNEIIQSIQINALNMLMLNETLKATSIAAILKNKNLKFGISVLFKDISVLN